jgi:hypothetical protein
MIAGLFSFFEQLFPPGLGHPFIIERTMPAAVATAMPTFEVIMFSEHYIAFGSIVKINALFQIRFQW